MHQVTRTHYEQDEKGDADQEWHDDAKGRPAAGELAAAIQRAHDDIVRDQRSPTGNIGGLVAQQIDLNEIVELAGGVPAGLFEVHQVNPAGFSIVRSHNIVGLDVLCFQGGARAILCLEGRELDRFPGTGHRRGDGVGQQTGVVYVTDRRVVVLQGFHQEAHADVEANYQRHTQQGQDKALFENGPPVLVQGDEPEFGH